MSRSRRNLGCWFIDLNSAGRFPDGLFGFLLGSRVGSHFPFTRPSLRGSDIGSGGWVTGRLIARRPGWLESECLLQTRG
jgi:hypothetical protein